MNTPQQWPSGITAGLFFLIVLAFPACTTPPPAAESNAEALAGQELITLITRDRERREAAAETYRQEHVDDLPTTAQEVIDRYLEAVGGRDGFDSIQTMVVRSRRHGVGGLLATHVQYYRKPLSYRWEQSDAPVVLATDGNRFWWTGAAGWDEIDDGTPFLSSVSLDNHLVDPEAVGIAYELIGVSTFDEHPGFEVRRRWPHGREDVLFFSAETGLLTLMRYPHPLGIEFWASYWDYRDVGGVSFPFVHVSNLDFGPPHGAVIESIDINVPLPDSLFSPAGERDPSEPIT